MTAEESEGEAGEALLAALVNVLEATRNVQRVFRESERRTEHNIARLRGGETVASIVRDYSPANARSEINDALDRLTSARQASRAIIFQQLVRLGMTRKEIAANWGFSQQVVSRIVHHDDPSG